MPTREEERETIARQEHKSRESALRFENIRTESEREKDMVAIIRECLVVGTGPDLNHIRACLVYDARPIGAECKALLPALQPAGFLRDD
jgi:hypothetical protein